MSKGVTVVLSGGGIRGIAHVGVLKILEEEGIPIRRIVGSSIGSLVGALYASCKDASRVESFVKGLPLYKLPDLSFSSQGFIAGTKLHRIIREFTGAERFEDLSIPLVVNATDLRTGHEIVFDKGPLLPALHASSAFPGVIRPLEHEGMLLVDGGVSNTLPVHLASKRMPVVISDVTGPGSLKARPSMFSVMRQSLHILIKNAIDEELEHTQRRFVRVRPDVQGWEIFSLRDTAGLIGRGEESMRSSLAALKRLF